METRNHPNESTPNNALLRDLQVGLRGEVIVRGHPDYDSARKIWNGFIDRYPAVIVRCHGVDDVVQAIRFARKEGLKIAVRGGGHSVGGFSTIDDGIVIDLSPMKEVLVNREKQTALASAGLTLGEFMRATEVYGLATTTGTVSDTGLAGLTLGGGIGWLMSKYGLACDNVLSFEMVTADGEVIRASAAENPDLYWGLRGGGGNLGIVTTFEFQLHPVSRVLGGMIIYPMARAREVFHFYRDFVDKSPDELTVYSVLTTSPDGHPVAVIVPCYFGDLQEGERILEPVRRFGPPIADLVRPMSYYEMITLIDEANPRGRNYYDKGGTLPKLTDEVIDRLVEAGTTLTSPFTALMIQHFHGAAARVPIEATAFSARGESFMPAIIASWEDGPAEPHIAWVRKAWDSLRPFSTDVRYVNFMSAEEMSQVPEAYGVNYTRLQSLKRRYDPENIFSLNQNIRPK